MALSLPLLIAVLLAVAAALPLSGLLGAGLPAETGAGFALMLLLAAIGAIAELASRLSSRRGGAGVLDLRAVGNLAGGKDRFGEKARGLSRLHGLGLPVPDTVVISAALGERLYRATGSGREPGQVFRELPPSDRRALRRFLRGCAGANVRVRASFVDEGAARTFSGVFESATAPADDLEAVAAALCAVLRSADGETVRAYRKRHRLVDVVPRALVIQREIEGDVVGAAGSRGVDGRADRTTVDYARRRSPVRSAEYDLLTGELESLSDSPALDASSWARLVSLAAVLVEEELRKPVRLDFAIADGRLFILQVTEGGVGAPRETWTCDFPRPTGGLRLPALVHDLRGGLAAEKAGLSAVLSRLSVEAGKATESLRYIDGTPYVDMQLVRRALAEQARRLLLRPPLTSVLRLAASLPQTPLPPLPQVPESTPDVWQALRRWHARHVVTAAQELWAVHTQRFLIQEAQRTLAAIADAQGARTLVLRRILAFAERRASARAARLLAFVEQSETLVGDVAQRVLARGVQAFDQMFAGDKHLHLGLDMIDQWMTGDEAARRALDDKWRVRRAALAQREEKPAPPRVHQPAIAEAATRPRTEMSAIGIVAGRISGTTALVDKASRGRIPEDAILVLPDGRAEHCQFIVSARGVVLLGGGVLSPAALLAGDLGVPTVLCTQSKPGALYAGRAVSIDGTTGAIEL